MAISVEAKADEPFDLPLVDVFSHSLERLLENPRSGGVARIVDLAQSLFGTIGKGDHSAGELRYQLLTVTAGTLAFANSIEANRAVVIVHEFETSATSRKKLALNATDLSAFVRRLSKGAVTEVTEGMLYGPFTVPGEPLFDRPASIFIGKAVRRLGKPGE